MSSLHGRWFCFSTGCVEFAMQSSLNERFFLQPMPSDLCGFPFLDRHSRAVVSPKRAAGTVCSVAVPWLSARRPRSAAAAPARRPRSLRGPGEPPRTTCWSGSSSGCVHRAGPAEGKQQWCLQQRPRARHSTCSTPGPGTAPGTCCTPSTWYLQHPSARHSRATAAHIPQEITVPAL